MKVLEYWGVLDADLARHVGLDVPQDASGIDQVQINAWVCGEEILRCVLNPFTPVRIPYRRSRSKSTLTSCGVLA